MEQQSFATSLAPEILVESVSGNLQVQGWDRSEISIQGDPENLRVEQLGDQLTLSCTHHCSIRIPQGASLQIDKVMGDARLKLLEDQTTIDEVHGSLVLRNMGDMQIGKVLGDLNAKTISGNLVLEKANGNIHVRDVQGKCLIQSASGNLDLRDIEGDIQAECKGNVGLAIRTLSGSDYRIECDGNLQCQIPAETSARIEIDCTGEHIRLQIPGYPREVNEKHYVVQLGEERALIQLSSRGNISLYGIPFGSESSQGEGNYSDDVYGVSEEFSEQISRQIETQVEAQLESLTRQLNEQLGYLSSTMAKSGLPPEDTDKIMERARVENERTTARAQQKIRQTQEKMERKLEAARRRAEIKADAARRKTQGAGRSTTNIPWPPTPPAPPEPVSDEERMLILKMLEQKKITLQEAEELLSALEGKA